MICTSLWACLLRTRVWNAQLSLKSLDIQLSCCRLIFEEIISNHMILCVCIIIIPGLCRTCEIFSVQSLVVNSIDVIEEKQFQSVSVTSEKWVSLHEVGSMHACTGSYVTDVVVAG